MSKRLQMWGNGTRPRTHCSGGDVRSYSGDVTLVMAGQLEQQERERGMSG